jgi:hypothetical protein
MISSLTAFCPDGARIGKVAMKKGEKMPVTLEFTSAQGQAALRLAWSWQGQDETIVPPAALSHKEEISNQAIGSHSLQGERVAEL